MAVHYTSLGHAEGDDLDESTAWSGIAISSQIDSQLELNTLSTKILEL